MLEIIEIYIGDNYRLIMFIDYRYCLRRSRFIGIVLVLDLHHLSIYRYRFCFRFTPFIDLSGLLLMKYLLSIPINDYSTHSPTWGTLEIVLFVCSTRGTLEIVLFVCSTWETLEIVLFVCSTWGTSEIVLFVVPPEG